MLTDTLHQIPPNMGSRRRWAATITAITTPGGARRAFAIRQMRIPSANRAAIAEPLAAIATALRDPAIPIDQHLLGSVVQYVADPASALYQPYPVRAAWRATELAQRFDNHPAEPPPNLRGGPA
jgi:hypothetical protein